MPVTSRFRFANRSPTSQTQDASESGTDTIGFALGFGPIVAGGGTSFPSYVPTPYNETDLTHQLSEEIRLTSRGR